MTAPMGDEESTGGGQNGEDHAFGDELLHEAAAAGADGDAHGHFMAAGERSDQEQIADVGAGDEEHKNDHGEHDAESGEQRAGVVERRLPKRPEFDVATAVGGGEIGFQTLRDG